MTWINSVVLAVNRFYRSAFYRVVLLIYGLVLCSLFPTLPNYLYVGTFLLYLLFLVLYVFSQNFSNALVRLLVDLVFMTICLYLKPLDNICVISMIFIPVANAINHSGSGKNNYCYIVGLFLVYMIVLFSNNAKGIDYYTQHIFYACVAFFSFLAIQWFTAKTWVAKSSEACLRDSIDDFYIHGIRHETLYKQIGQTFIDDGCLFEDMFCFISHNKYHSLYVVNGSRFVYNYKISADVRLRRELLNNNVCENVPLVVDDKKFNYTIAIPCNDTLFPNNSEHTCYLFLLCFKKKTSKEFWNTLNIKNGLYRLAQCLYTERMIRLRKRETFEQIKDKGRFVDSAINTMHFIKNRLSSLQALTDVINDMDTSSFNHDYIEVAKSAARTSKTDIKSIIEKAKYLLNKENNPFHYLQEEACKPRKMFATLRQVWVSILSDSDLVVENTELLEKENRFIETNMEGVEILFSDIIGNMSKYQKTKSICYCSCFENQLSVKFQNDFLDKKLVLSLIDSYNRNDKEEIIKRKTFGVSNIKSFVADMHIGLIACLEKVDDIELFTITLSFTIKNENSDNRE